MNRSDFGFISDTMNCKCNIVTVNQNTTKKIENYKFNDISITAVSTDETGLSNSRNMLIDNAKGDIEIIGDDDLTYIDGYTNIIKNAYNELADADIIIFQYAKYPNIKKAHNPVLKKKGRIKMVNVSRVRSVEITFKRKSIVDAGIRFDSEFGLGAKYETGEENIFIADALRKGLNVYYYPSIICLTPSTPPERAKFAEGYTSLFFICKGACFYRIYKNMYWLYTIAYLIKKKNTVLKDNSFFSALRYMNSGKKEYLAAKGK